MPEKTLESHKVPSFQDLMVEIESVARKNSSKVALMSDDGEFTYYEMLNEANKVATALLAAGLKSGDRVANMYPPGSKKIIAFLGVLKAGMTFVSTDSNMPEYLLKNIYKSINVMAEIGPDASNSYEVKKIFSSKVLSAEEYFIEDQISVSTALIQFTSGTTGLPKAIPISQIALATFVSHIEDDYNGLGENYLHFNQFWAPYILLVFKLGNKLLIYDISSKGVSGVPDFMIRNNVNILTSYTAMFRQIRNLGVRKVPSLNAITLVGEPVQKSDAQYFEAISNQGATLFASYGASEYHTIARYIYTHSTDLRQSILPAGSVYAGIDLRVVDQEYKKVFPLITGEIVLVSAATPEKYLNNREMSEKNFRCIDSTGEFAYFTGDMGYIDLDGILHCVGRKDDHVKIRGNLVNVKEVEYVLSNMNIFDQVAVSSSVGKSNNTRLFCCYTANCDIDPQEIKNAMRPRVPGYMVPSLFQRVESIPTTSSGKVSKRDLEEMVIANDSAGAASEPSRVEEIIRKIFEKTLEHYNFELDDDFFDVGGDSLAAFTLVARIESEFGIKLTFEEIFLVGSSVKHLAQVVSSEIENHNPAFLVPLNYSASMQTFYALPPFNGHLSDYVPLGECLSNSAKLLGVRLKRLMLDDLDKRPSIQEIAFDAATLIASQSHLRNINIIGYSAGGIFAFETASLLISWGYKINSLVLIDSPSLHSRQRSWFSRVRVRPLTASGIIAFARRNVSSVRRDISRILSVVSLPPNNISTVDYGIQMQKWTPFRISIKTPILFVTEAGPVKHDHQKKWCLLLGRKLEFIHLEGNHFGLREEIIAHEVATKIITRVSI